MPALFFDLDDTILAYESVATQAWSEACDLHIRHFQSLTAEQLKQVIDEASSWFWSDPDRHRVGRLDLKQARRDVVRLAFQKLSAKSHELPSDEIADAIADHFTVRREELMHPFPGAIETLTALRNKKTPLALITNGAEEGQQKKIDRHNLAQYFDIILIEGACGYGKPDARIFERALFHFEIAPRDATMVGDNLEADIYGAQQIGIKTVWNDWSRRGLPQDAPAKPDKTIHSIKELV